MQIRSWRLLRPRETEVMLVPYRTLAAPFDGVVLACLSPPQPVLQRQRQYAPVISLPNPSYSARDSTRLRDLAASPYNSSGGLHLIMAPIHAAACDANVGALRRILAEGVLPDAIDVTFEGTPLHALCKSEWAAGDRVACFKLLRDAGANLEARQFISNFTPLHYSALRTNVELVSLLIQAGVDLNAPAQDGFHAAALCSTTS